MSDLGHDFLTVPLPCPGCGAANDGHLKTSTMGRSGGPQPGDVSICAYCATVAVYGNGTMVLAPPELRDQPAVRRAVAYVRMRLQQRKADLS